MLWYRKRRHKKSPTCSSSEREDTPPTLEQTPAQTPTPSHLGLSHTCLPHHPTNTHRLVNLRTPIPTDNQASPLHHTATVQSHEVRYHSPSAHHNLHSPHPTPHTLTMTEAAGIAQIEDNLDDGSSVDLSNYAHSEYSFISKGSVLSRSPNPLQSSATLTHKSPLLHSPQSVFRPLPNSPHVYAQSCSCSCHSSDHVSTPSPSPSMPLLSPRKQRPPKRLALSPTLAPIQPSDFQHHYSLWSERRHHYQLPSRSSPVSPV